MRRSILALITAFSSLLSAMTPAAAHPDIAASVRLTFELDGKALTGFSERLVFDAASSRRLVSRFDADRDGTLSQPERDALASELLDRLGAQHFYTELSLNGEGLSLSQPAAADLEIRDGFVDLHLHFRFASPADLRNFDLGVLIRDRDLVIAFGFDPRQSVIVSQKNGGACATRIEARPDEAYFGGLVTPSVVTLTCR